MCSIDVLPEGAARPTVEIFCGTDVKAMTKRYFLPCAVPPRRRPPHSAIGRFRENSTTVGKDSLRSKADVRA